MMKTGVIMANNKSDKPNIFDFNNFRLYLSAYYDFRHKRDKSFTKSYICRKMGLPNTRSYFGDVIKGKYLSAIKVPLFIKLLELDKNEAQFFRALINFNQAVDLEERELFFDQLISLNQTPKSIISSKIYRYYREWYNPVIRTLLHVIDFKTNYALLAKTVYPPIRIKQARESVKLLLSLGLIRRNSKGFLKPTDKVLSTAPFVKDELVTQYQLECLNQTKKVILCKNRQPRRIITKMMGISREAYIKIEKKMEKISSEITSLVHKDENPADRVYQLTMQLIPNSKIQKKDKV